MATMLRDVATTAQQKIVNLDALKSEIRNVLITQKATALPICVRIGWHASGTYDVNDDTGGSNGGRMRFNPEKSDPANAGLGIIRDLLLPIHKKHPEISLADLWCFSAVCAMEFVGGPKIPFKFGRIDFQEPLTCPISNGRLPDASQGADHLRHVFGRMGFNDQEIVALSGAHTLGRCHVARSGFDGPWTTKPLQFDNEYFKNLLNLEWVPRNWNGPLQYMDKETKSLMMLPTDLALIQDSEFRPWVEKYANDSDLFFKDFANAFAKLLCLGCPEVCNPFIPDSSKESDQDVLNGQFREHAMHGSVEAVKKCVEQGADIHQLEPTSHRSALHKSAFWGHDDCVQYLLDIGIDANLQDVEGDTALHDAAKFGHVNVCKMLIPKTDLTKKNLLGQTVYDVAKYFEKDEILELLGKSNGVKKRKVDE